MMEKQELTLSELKSIEFDLLKRFRSFCEQNNIEYYIVYGTLLGAVRYKGFIPWDDDVDVAVPRKDYERLISLYEDDERYKLFAYEKDKRFKYPFAKLSDMTTRKEEFCLDNGVPLGVEIDIFPIDNWDNNYDKAKKEAKRISRYMLWLFMSKHTGRWRFATIKQFLGSMYYSACRCIGSGFFIERIKKECIKESQAGSAYVGIKAWCVYGEKGIIPAEAFEETIELEFEGEKFPAPAGYDTFLTCLYGDYLPEPPKEKQKTHHNFHAYRLADDGKKQ